MDTMTPVAVASDLFSPVQVGAFELRNRVVMAPLTRSRAGAGDAPGPMNAEYYAQRASAGLIISEATQITQQGKGYAFTPGIYTEAQIAGWRLTTDAVHAAGGRIVCQLWHVGRISHPDLQEGGALPVSASALRPEGQAFTEAGFKPHVTPRALETAELPGIVRDYRHAAECAKRAGFDGVELHSANGYLMEQFIRDSTNHRSDSYGGSLANRLRLPLEVAAAIVEVWGADRVGIRLSPVSPNVSIAPDSDPMTTYGTLAAELGKLGLAYLHCVEGATTQSRDIPEGFSFARMREAFGGIYMANNCYDRAMALGARAEDTADLICFGRAYIANPDLVERLRRDAPLAAVDPATMYGGDARGYTDYPPLTDQH